MSLEEEAAAVQYGIDKHRNELSNWVCDNICMKINHCVVGEDCGGCMAGDILNHMDKEIYEDENGKRCIRNKI